LGEEQQGKPESIFAQVSARRIAPVEETFGGYKYLSPDFQAAQDGVWV